MKFLFVIIFMMLNINLLTLKAQEEESDLRHWPQGSSPSDVGKRIVNKFLNTPHSRYGNTHPDIPPTQITYPDVCAWLGGIWFAEVTHDKPMLFGLETRFNPLFEEEKNLLPKPNHVDNNMF